jgi:hypothetical protein
VHSAVVLLWTGYSMMSTLACMLQNITDPPPPSLCLLWNSALILEST